MVEIMTKELSILGSIKLKDSKMFSRYVVAQRDKDPSFQASHSTERSTLIIQRKRTTSEGAAV